MGSYLEEQGLDWASPSPGGDQPASASLESMLSLPGTQKAEEEGSEATPGGGCRAVEVLSPQSPPAQDCGLGLGLGQPGWGLGWLEGLWGWVWGEGSVVG